MHFRIYSDGTSRGTKIYNDRGEQLENVVAIQLLIDANEAEVCAVLVMKGGIELDAVGDAEVVQTGIEEVA